MFVIFEHEPNSVGRAKLRRLTTEIGKNLKQIANEIRYSRTHVTQAANGHPLGDALVEALERYTGGKISRKDWETRFDGDAGAVPILKTGRPRKNTPATITPLDDLPVLTPCDSEFDCSSPSSTTPSPSSVSAAGARPPSSSAPSRSCRSRRGGSAGG